METEPTPIISETARAKDTTVVFGFWMYLMTDLVLFASLFAVFAVLRTNSAFGPSPSDIVNAPYVLIETLLLLTSSFVAGLAVLSIRTGKKWQVLTRLALSAFLGLLFVIMELMEFAKLVAAGNGPQASGFLSAYFTLVGTHGLHIIIGLLWSVALMISIASRGLTRGNMRKLVLWSLFWHFLDIVWIFIFTIVYLYPLI